MNREAKLQTDIINALHDEGYSAYPVEFRNARGLMDLLVMKQQTCENGLVVWMEIKTDDGILSDNQQNTILEFQNNGQHVRIIRSVDEAINFADEVFDG